MDEILKEWKESEACRRIATLESYCQAHGFEEFDGQSIPDWFKEKLVEFEKKTKEEFLKRILPYNQEEKNDFDAGWNDCMSEIINNASKDGVALIK